MTPPIVRLCLLTVSIALLGGCMHHRAPDAVAATSTLQRIVAEAEADPAPGEVSWTDDVPVVVLVRTAGRPSTWNLRLRPLDDWSVRVPTRSPSVIVTNTAETGVKSKVSIPTNWRQIELSRLGSDGETVATSMLTVPGSLWQHGFAEVCRLAPEVVEPWDLPHMKRFAYSFGLLLTLTDVIKGDKALAPVRRAATGVPRMPSLLSLLTRFTVTIVPGFDDATPMPDGTFAIPIRGLAGERVALEGVMVAGSTQPPYHLTGGVRRLVLHHPDDDTRRIEIRVGRESTRVIASHFEDHFDFDGAVQGK